MERGRPARETNVMVNYLGSKGRAFFSSFLISGRTPGQKKVKAPAQALVFALGARREKTDEIHGYPGQGVVCPGFNNH